MNFFTGDQDDTSCNDYHVLNDPTRNSDYATTDYFCDDTDDDEPSPDWHGPGWYRLGMPAGNTIPEEPVEPNHCNTQETGWLNGNHPAPGNTIDGTVCFYSTNGDSCGNETQIQIKHCDEYFLYYLPEPPNCHLRYCASNSTLIGIHMLNKGKN